MLRWFHSLRGARFQRSYGLSYTMPKFSLVFLLLLFPLTGSATGYTWGKLEYWMPRLAAAEEYLEIEDTEFEASFDADKRASAMMVYGFIHGVSDAHMIDHWARLKFKYGGNIPDEKINEDHRAVCLDEAYFESIPKLIKFIKSKNYEKNEEFATVFLEFAMQEYKCN